MIIVSQNKERVLWFGRAFNALEYNEDISKKGKQEIIRHPSGTGGYIVTNIKELTKKQREFLYDYFMDMGDRFKAEQFWRE